MSFFKKGDTPLKTIVENKECKRHYKYLEKSKKYNNLGGHEYTSEWGFSVTHELDNKVLHIGELDSGPYTFMTRGNLTLCKRVTIEALIDTLQACLEEW